MVNNPTAEIIAIGSELLSGYIVDTNSAYISRVFSDIGISTGNIAAVGDDENKISAAISLALARSDVVLTTGGLGPTVDDKTRLAVANAVSRSLVFKEELLEQISERFKKWDRKMSDNNLQQAYIPQDAISIENPVGTAPIFIVEHKDKCIICLPGVPREMKYLLKNEIVPYLKKYYANIHIIKKRVIHTVGAGESVIDANIGHLESLTNPVVGLNAHQGQVDIRITATGSSEEEVDRLIDDVEKDVRSNLGDFVFGVDGQSLASVVLNQLKRVDHTVSVVECGSTGQLIKSFAEADKCMGIFDTGFLLGNNFMQENDIEGTLEQMIEYSRVYNKNDFVIASVLNVTYEKTKIGVQLWKSSDESRQTTMRSYGGHVAYAGEWAASLGLDLLRRVTL